MFSSFQKVQNFPSLQTSLLKDNEKKLSATLAELNLTKQKLDAANEQISFLQSGQKNCTRKNAPLAGFELSSYVLNEMSTPPGTPHFLLQLLLVLFCSSPFYGAFRHR
jgi:hypothetical protein